MEHLTPEQAWSHIKALCPSAEYILKHKRFQCEVIGSGRQTYVAAAEINWPDGVDRWPPPEPKYRYAKMPEDFGATAECCRDGLPWVRGVKLAGYAEMCSRKAWLDVQGERWDKARIRVDNEETWKGPGGHIFNKQGECKCGHSTGDDPERCPFDDGWMSMDTAPKNERIRVKMGSIETIAEWSRAGSIWVSESPHGIAWDRANQPTAWRPIP